MTETSRFWEGTTVGDATAAPYDSHTEFAEVLMALAQANRTVNKGGVFIDELNELAVSGVASPVSVATGRALVYGTWYQSDAVISVAVPASVSGTTGHRIVLRKLWASQTVRVVIISSADGVAAIPALTQSAAVQWEIPLASISAAVGGVLTVTDEREWLPIPAGSIGVQELSAATMVKLAGGVLVAPASIIDISSISQLYKHLRLYIHGRSSKAAAGTSGILIQFNLDAGANYEVNEVCIDYNTNTFQAFRWTGLGYGTIGEFPGVGSGGNPLNFADSVVDIPFYSDAVHYKNVYSHNASAMGSLTDCLDDNTLWKAAAAINAIRLTCGSDNFVTGTEYTLYGVPA